MLSGLLKAEEGPRAFYKVLVPSNRFPVWKPEKQFEQIGFQSFKLLKMRPALGLAFGIGPFKLPYKAL